MSTRTQEAGGGYPPVTTLERPRCYQQSAPASRAKSVIRAADVLCLLTFFPLMETAREGFVALLARRIERAYAEDDR